MGAQVGGHVHVGPEGASYRDRKQISPERNKDEKPLCSGERERKRENNPTPWWLSCLIPVRGLMVIAALSSMRCPFILPVNYLFL